MYPVEASIETASYGWFLSRCILKDTTLVTFASKRSSEFNKKTLNFKAFNGTLKLENKLYNQSITSVPLWNVVTRN